MKTLTNFHVLTVKYSGPTNSRGARVVIRSDRFKKSKTIDYDHDLSNIYDMAVNHLSSLAVPFEFIGKAEGKDCYYLISTTFISL